VKPYIGMSQWRGEHSALSLFHIFWTPGTLLPAKEHVFLLRMSEVLSFIVFDFMLLQLMNKNTTDISNNSKCHAEPFSPSMSVV